MIRHTALFRWGGERVDPERVLRIKEGLAYISYAGGVLGLDFGEDLGVSAVSTHDLALHHDHRDRAAWDEYNEDEHHARVGALIRSLTVPEAASRVDWVYDGPAAERYAVRDLALFVWKEGIDDGQKAAVFAGLDSLRRACPTVRSLEFGVDLGWHPPNHDWIFEAHFEDPGGFREFLEHDAQREAAGLIAATTRLEATARLQHRVRAG